MSLKEKMEMIMLPTEEATHLHKRIDDGILQNTARPNNQNPCWERQYLYIYSNREIKEGDYYVGEGHSVVHKARLSLNMKGLVIIASTDTSLGLPNIPTEFIQEYVDNYNEGSPIREVMIEMEEFHDGSVNFNEMLMNTRRQIRIKSNNTIIISKVEETWDDIYGKYFQESMEGNLEDMLPFEVWLKKNYSVPLKLSK